LREQQPSLDSFPEPHFVRQDRAARERIAKGKESCLDLVGVEVNLRIRKHRGELFHAVGGAAPGEIVGKVFGVKGGDVHSARCLS
jgi:hypothetical protein